DIKGVQPVGRMPGQVDEAGKKARERLARSRRRDEQRMLAALRRREHVGLVPPQPPPARGEPVGEGGGQGHGGDVAWRRVAGKSPNRWPRYGCPLSTVRSHWGLCSLPFRGEIRRLAGLPASRS